MEKIKIGIVGFGNLGKGVFHAVQSSKDMECTVVFTRRVDNVKKQTFGVPVVDVNNFTLLSSVKPDVVILCGGSKNDIPVQGPQFAKMFNTVDSFDTHVCIPQYFKDMRNIATENNHVSIISTGWDPGLFSLMRVLFKSILPQGKDYTFWGPGISQGHSDAIRTIPGVIDARQYTIPIDEAINSVRSGINPILSTREKHKRVCYVVVKNGADKNKIERQIKEMPNYFADYDTDVDFVSCEELKQKHFELPHGGFVINSATTGSYQQTLEFGLKLKSNPYFTGSVLVAYARAAYRLALQKKYGAYTVLEIPPILLSPLEAEDLMKMI